MAATRQYPPPLAIRRSRDRVEAVKDIIEWVENLSGRELKNDPENTKEVTNMIHYWESLNSGDGVLFERDAANQVVACVFEIRP